tara:strand:+ start:54 stop:197 length:144 start_codon:yes stop_codon:yes gene_type:complete
MPKLNKKILKENIELVLNNFDLDQFSSHFEHEEDFKWLIKHLSDCFE